MKAIRDSDILPTLMLRIQRGVPELLLPVRVAPTEVLHTMSQPSLLEYPLTSRRPLIVGFPGINSGVPHRTQILFGFLQSFVLPSCLERFRYRFAVLFSSQSFRTADLTCWRHFNLKQCNCTKILLAIHRSPTPLAAIAALFRGEAPHRRAFHPDADPSGYSAGLPI